MLEITDARARRWTIGELSELTGVNIETIRYYERIKLFRAPPRTAGGRRVYDSDHLRILAFVRRARELGFSLEQVRALLRLGGPANASCRQVRDVASGHLSDIRTRIADLRKLERLLAKTVAQCTGTTAPECPILDILDRGYARAAGGADRRGKAGGAPKVGMKTSGAGGLMRPLGHATSQNAKPRSHSQRSSAR